MLPALFLIAILRATLVCVIYVPVDKVRRYFTVQAGMWHLDALNLKPETSHLKPCRSDNGLHR